MPTDRVRRCLRPKKTALAAVCAMACSGAMAADELDDALSLQSAPAAETQAPSPLRLMVEGAVGELRQRGRDGEEAHRATLDLRYSAAPAAGWRFTLSDRLDSVHPALSAPRSTLNSLREAFVGWQSGDSAGTVDVGRVNLRNGPAFGYNPTDYFRTGALRVVTTADPVALREMRQGTLMLRAGRQWGDTAVSLALAPKVDDTPGKRTFSLDLGSTNATDRALLSANVRFSERVGVQALVLAERGSSAKVGGSVTALLSDAAVAYAEVSGGRSRTVLASLLGTDESRHYGQAAAGLTYTLQSKLSLTVEAEYNGGGVDRNEWLAALSQGDAAYARYVALTQRSQELAFRRAWLLYATQKDLFVKQLDLTALLRVNAVDHSRLGWVELRRRWTAFDLAVQWQVASGNSLSEFGTLPVRQVVQLVGSWYF